MKDTFSSLSLLLRAGLGLAAAFILVAFMFAPPAKKEVILSQRMVESHGLKDFYCNRLHEEELDSADWDYVSGLVANAVIKAWQQYPEKIEYYKAVKAFADVAVAPDGKQILNAKGQPALKPSNLDDLHAGKILFPLYEHELKIGNTKDAERYKNALALIRNKLKNEHASIKQGLPGAGGFFHKAIYPNQMWLDGLYMGAATYAQWQGTFGATDPKDNEESWSDIAMQFKILHAQTYDASKQLNYHGWTATPSDSNAFWAKKKAPFLGCSPEFWGRGMGWYFAALVDVLEYMPKDHKDYENVKSICNQVAAGLKRWQDKKSGVWFQLLQYDSTMRGDGKGDLSKGKTYNLGTAANYREASCSSIFTYAFLKGIRLGVLDKDTYLPTAKNAYDGLVKHFIRGKEDRVDIVQICASAGLGPASNPSRTGTTNYYLCGEDVTIVENEGKAIGTFILASLEFEKLR